MLLELALVSVAIRVVVRWDHPVVHAVNAHHRLKLVSVVDLVEQLAINVCGQDRVVCASFSDLYQFDRVSEFVAQSEFHGFVLLLVPLNFMLEQLLLPVVRPSLANFVPCSRARLWLVVSATCNVIKTIDAHVDVSFTQNLLIARQEVAAKFLCKLLLKVKTILVAEYIKGAVNELLMVSDRHTAPVGVVGPCCQVREHLTFTAALLAPEEHSALVTLEAIVDDAADVVRAPMVVTELLIAL